MVAPIDFAICLARKVFPVPDGPEIKIPFTCGVPNCFQRVFGNIRDAKTFLNRPRNAAGTSFRVCIGSSLNCTLEPAETKKEILVCLVTFPFPHSCHLLF